MKRRRFLALSLPATACVALAPRAALAADEVKVGMLRVPTALLVGIDQGYFAAQGIDAQPVFFTTDAELVPALSTGQVDLGITAPGATLFNTLAPGVDATIVADAWVSANGSPSGDSTFVMVRKDLAPEGVFKNVDAKGLTIAITAHGEVAELFLDAYLATLKVSPGDVNVVEMPLADMSSALFNRAVDIAVTVDPYATILATAGTAVKVASLSALMPGCVQAVIVYGKRLERTDRALGLRFMRAFSAANLSLRAQLATPDDRVAIGKLYQKYVPLDDPTLYTKIGLAVGPEKLTVDVEGRYGLRWESQQYVKAGLVDKAPDLKAAVDDSFAVLSLRSTSLAPLRMTGRD
jgi:NitT/TauT family transport system substrate-binding protein